MSVTSIVHSVCFCMCYFVMVLLNLTPSTLFATTFFEHLFNLYKIRDPHLSPHVCFRDVYVSTMQPQSKHIVILVDHGISLSQTQMRTARSIARNLLLAFTEHDRVCTNLESLVGSQLCELVDSVIQGCNSLQNFFMKFINIVIVKSFQAF